MICTNRDAMELARTAPATLAALGRVQIRLSHEVGVISDAQYHSLAQALTETGRMIGGWKKAGGAGSAVRGDRSVDQSSLKPVEP